MYYAGKIVTVIFSMFCIYFTKDLQSIFLSLGIEIILKLCLFYSIVVWKN